MNHARALVFVSVLVAGVGCDHATKYAATALIEPAGVISLASGALRFEVVYNAGAFLGLGAGLPPLVRTVLLGGLVPLGLLVLVAGVLRSAAATPFQLAALGLIVGGGFGNWIDRILHDGHVTDFVSLGIGPLHTGIFNFADVAVVGGMLALLLASRGTGSAEAEPE
jgi:signal peptidase II